MASIGRFAISAGGAPTGIYETMMALVNMNIDFSVVRYEARPEIQEVGNRLSKRRKTEAEDGKIHHTARRLGALFADEIPPVESLCKVYGLRASEIVSNPSINPQGSASHGALAAHVGIDATALWAAATSGPGSLQVHLLACMLARYWSGAAAVSIWSEMIAARRAELELRLQDSMFPRTYLTLARIDIGLQEIAEWDDSARSWLAAADQAYNREQTKIMLIIDNLGIGLPKISTLYHDVMNLWKSSLLFMDKIASGVAQSVDDPHVLAGLASWHLYPDIVVLGYGETKDILLNDSLLPTAAVVTIGMRSPLSRPDRKGLEWTLPLRHLKYYGKPTEATSVLGLTSLRITFDKFALVAIGSLLSSWSVYCSDLKQSLDFLVSLRDRLEEEEAIHTICKDACQRHHGGLRPRNHDWIKLIAARSKLFLEATETEQREMIRYINLGRIKFTKLLSRRWTPGPVLGLHSVPTFLQLLEVETQIKVLRRFVARSSQAFDYSKALIYTRPTLTSAGEFASLTPQNFVVDGVTQSIHRRWILPIHVLEEGTTFTDSVSLSNEDGSDKIEQSDPFEFSYGPKSVISLRTMTERAAMIMAESGEPCGLLNDSTIACLSEGKAVALDHRYTLQYRTHPETIAWHKISPSQLSNELANNEKAEALVDDIVSSLLCEGKIKESSPGQLRNTVLSGLRIGRAKAAWIGNQFRRIVCSSKVSVYLPVSSSEDQGIAFPLDFISECMQMLPHEKPILSTYLEESGKYEENKFFRSLFGLCRASEIYSHMPNATIDVEVASKALHPAKWLVDFDEDEVTRTSFACVAYFDSGGRIDFPSSHFENVMAISSKNWLYIARALLDDPEKESEGICCVIGNIGKPGMSLLVSPDKPEMKEDDSLDTWHLVNHVDFDGRYENNFGGTSLHLMMTGSIEPLSIGDPGARYVEVSRVEATVSIFHRGELVGDIDVLGLFAKSAWQRSWLGQRALPEDCGHDEDTTSDMVRFGKITAIDNWQEMLNHLPNTAIVRAKNNWDARLALASVMRMRSSNAIIARQKVCWVCVMGITKRLNISPFEVMILC